jgi:hypothetical protein
MRPSQARYITACQQVLALGAVLAVLAPAAGVISLDVVTRHPDGATASASAGGFGGYGAITPDAAPARVAARPVDAKLREISLTPKAIAPKSSGRPITPTTSGARLIHSAAGTTSLLSTPQPVDGFGTVGVTWAHGENYADGQLAFQVRTRTDGVWSDWQVLHYDADHGPDPGSEEAARERPGTDAMIIGTVDEVQIKATSETGVVPDDMSLAVINPGSAPTEVETPAIDTGELDAARADGTESGVPGEPTSTPEPAVDQDPATAETGTDGIALQSGTVTAKPHIFSRAQWGADESMRDASSLHYYEVHAGFVHHTVNANDYTKDEVPGILRSIYAYHTQSKGWSDIGYNFLVDRFGRIWEGRYGGVDRPVVGAHTLGYNDYSFAMSAIGNFEIARPSSVMLDAYARLFAWKLSLHGVDVSSTKQRVGDSWFQAINGHRDAGQTACPGKYLYAKLPMIRTLAATYQADWGGRQRDVNVADTTYPDLMVRRTSDKAGFIVPTQGLLRLTVPRVSQSSGWSAMDSIVASPDLTGDGKVDVVARNASTGESMVYPGDGAGHFGVGIKPTGAFKGLDEITAVGDLNGDRRSDLVARNPNTGRLHLFYNIGGGSFRHTLLSSAWAAYDKVAGVGDFTGDGKRDLLARSTSGGLWLFPGTGSAHLGAPKQLAGNWSGYDVLTGYGDYNKDGRPDLFARSKTGLGYVFPNLGGGTFGHWLGPLPTVKGLTSVTSGGNVTDGGPADLVARHGDALVVVAHTGTYDTSAAIPMSANLSSATMLLNVGDWDGDGHGDLVTRTSTGALFLRLGNGAGSFGAPTQIGSGFDKVGLLAAAGDVTGDGFPDLMGQPTGGAMRIYPGRGIRGLGVSYVAHGAISAYRQIGVGLWDGDGAPDSLFRVGNKLAFYPGNGPGGLVGSGSTLNGDLTAYDWVIGVGSVTGSSHPDLIVREKATGYLWVLPGTATGFGMRQFLGEGFAGYDLAG